jgi:hypothetical protein
MSYKSSEKFHIEHSWTNGDKSDHKVVGYEYTYQGPKAGFETMLSRPQQAMTSIFQPMLKSWDDAKREK